MINKKKSYNNLNDSEESGPELYKINKEHNFRVPENYFDELPQIIQERVNRKKLRFTMDHLFIYFTKPIRLIPLVSLIAALFIGLFIVINQNQKELQLSGEITFEDIMIEFPDMIEYMDDEDLLEFAATQMTQQDIDMIDYEFGFDSILFQNEVFQHLSEDEITEILYN